MEQELLHVVPLTVCVRTIYWMAFWQLKELGVMTDEDAITEAAEPMLGSQRRSDGVFTARSRAINVSDYQVTWDWEEIETAMCTFVQVDVQASKSEVRRA